MQKVEVASKTLPLVELHVVQYVDSVQVEHVYWHAAHIVVFAS